MTLVNQIFKYFSFLFILLFYSSCDLKHNERTINGYTMGTTYSITIANSKEEEDSFKNEIDSLLSIINKNFSTYLDDSEISNINTQQLDLITLSDDFAYVLEKALYYCRLSDGSYDITIAPLVDLWGFGPSGSMDFPNKKYIQDALQNIGYQNIILKDNILLNKNKLKIDLNSIAKGYGVDRIFEYILEKGYSDFLVEIGGEIRSSNTTKDAWIIGIQNPEENSIIKKIKLNNKSMATSGTYNNFFEYKEKKYSHILNPKTGYPYMYNSVSATIITDKCIDADAYATLAMTMSPDKVIDLINKDTTTECYILEIQDDKIIEYKSNDFDTFIF